MQYTNSELHIFGGGSYAKELLDPMHPNIKYFGLNLIRK